MGSVYVIVPCYRYGHFLRECVESVLTQGGVDVRVLIIDDASPDNTAEVCQQLAREDSRVIFSRHRRNKGHIATYNEGIEWISADYYLLLSADDYLLPGAFGRAASMMDEDVSVAFVFGRAVEIARDGSARETALLTKLLGDKERCVVPGLEFIEFSGARNVVPTPTAVIRTALQKRLGGYRPELPHAGDMEMWLRLAVHGSVGRFEAPRQFIGSIRPTCL